MSIDLAFFGCWGEAGHYMFAPGRQKIHHPELSALPRDSDLDGSHLFLPYPERVGEGRLTYLPALNLSVLSWWNRVFDTRGAVNSHIMLRNEMRLDLVWAVFAHTFPDLAGHHEKPIIGRTY